MRTSLVLAKADKHLTIYKDMCRAIGFCHRVDECKDIADKSAAFAAYFTQIKDEATVQKFNEVRLRAWQRIAKLFATVDTTKGETHSAKIQMIRAAFDDAAMTEISDGKIRELLELSVVSDGDFAEALRHRLTGSIADLLKHTPKHQAMVRVNQERKSPKRPTAEDIERERNSREQSARVNRHFSELSNAANTAMKEVGITLERKDRANMKQVVFLIRDEVHEVLRQIAFDQKVTMQEILRRGLKAYAVSHGYKLPG